MQLVDSVYVVPRWLGLIAAAAAAATATPGEIPGVDGILSWSSNERMKGTTRRSEGKWQEGTTLNRVDDAKRGNREIQACRMMDVRFNRFTSL